MNNTSHKMPVIWVTIMLAMSVLYACTDADSSGDNTPIPTLQAGDITYASIAHGTPGTVPPMSQKTSNFSGLSFVIAPNYKGTETGTHEPPTIAEDGTIETTATTSAGSYKVTITPDGITFLGDPFIADFYVTIKVTGILDLEAKLKQGIKDYGLEGDFNYIDTSTVTDMSYLFAPGYTPGTDGTTETDRTYVQGFNGDISKWNVSIVENFSSMFQGASAFNKNIGSWNVSSGTNFSGMFKNAAMFNQNIGNWDVSVGENFAAMFEGATVFNQNIGEDVSSGNTGWDVSSGTNFAAMFQRATAFNQNIGSWNVSAGTNFSNMFAEATRFNQDLSNWVINTDTDNITNMFIDSGVTTFPSWYPIQKHFDIKDIKQN